MCVCTSNGKVCWCFGICVDVGVVGKAYLILLSVVQGPARRSTDYK